MKMLVHLFNPETERRDSEEIGASAAREEFLEMKANFVLAGLDARSAYDRMVELAIRPSRPSAIRMATGSVRHISTRKPCAARPLATSTA
jgi:hypothetical protein